MKFRSLILCSLSLVLTTTAFAHTPEVVKRKARTLSQSLQNRADRLSGQSLDVLEQLLDEANSITLGRGRLPRTPTQPLPPQNICTLLTQGNVGHLSYQYRIALNDQVLEGADRLDSILDKLARLEQDGMCVTRTLGACTFLSTGAFGSMSYNYRIGTRETVLTAHDRMDTALQSLEKLKKARVCESNPYPTHSCQVLAQGRHGGMTYNYRIGIGENTVFATDRYETLLDTMKKLRAAGACQ
jgi:hypothetical protein